MKKSIAVMSCSEGTNISNDMIFKDVCLIPILMKEKYDFEAYIVTYGINEELLKKYFQDINCVNINITGNYLIDINDYLQQNAAKIDIVYLFGAYRSYDMITKLYKMYNPQGKIYLKLDMNRYWLSYLKSQKYFKNLLEISDLVTVEDTKLQNIINNEYNAKVESVSQNEALMKNNCYKIQDYIRNEGTWEIIISKLYLLFCANGLA